MQPNRFEEGPPDPVRSYIRNKALYSLNYSWATNIPHSLYKINKCLLFYTTKNLG